jgi:hypothetical protein
MCNIDEIVNLVPSFGIFCCDTCCFSKASQLSSFPYWYLWCLWKFCGWSSSIYHKINWAFGHALKAKIALVYCVNLFGYHVLFLVSILCIIFLCDNYLCDVVYLETYTHEGWYSLFNVLFEPCVFGWNTKQYHPLRTMWMLYVHHCTSLIIYFLILITIPLVEPFNISLPYL